MFANLVWSTLYISKIVAHCFYMSFIVEKKVLEAHSPRLPGSTILPEDESKLKIVYNKFTPKVDNSSPDKIRINLLFSHGTGMNKENFNYHIRKLFEILEQNPETWYLGAAISFDSVSHGDSALLNQGKLGWAYGWADGAKDLIKIVRHENENCNDFFNNATSKNIILGHSAGGHHVIMAGFFEPYLFDTIIPIEPVYYNDRKLEVKYRKIFAKVADLIMDEFDSYEDFKEYYTQFSFYKSMKPEILNEFLENEYYTVTDAATGEVKYKTKASKLSQIAVYLSSAFCLERSKQIVPLIETKICFVVGEKATWNPPDSVGYFIKNANPNSLIEHHIVKDAQHLLHGEKPDELVAIIKGLIGKRSQAAIEDKPYYPNIKYNNDKQKILQERSEMFLAGNLFESIDFSKKQDRPRL